MSTSEHINLVNASEETTAITLDAQQLLRVHEEFGETHDQNEITIKTEHPTTAENTDLNSSLYDTNFPSLSASSTPATKPSLAWGAKSGAAAVRSGITISSVGEYQKSATGEAITLVAP